MSKRRIIPRPTDAELKILDILWRDGDCTVRHVMNSLKVSRGYTTALKLLQIMHEKGLVIRDESEKTHVYRSRFSRAQVQGHLLGDLLDRAFGGSAAHLVSSLLGEKRASEEEIAEIRRLIDEAEGGV